MVFRPVKDLVWEHVPSLTPIESTSALAGELESARISSDIYSSWMIPGPSGKNQDDLAVASGGWP